MTTVACLALTSSSVAVAADAALASPSPQVAADDPGTRPDAASAKVAARALGRAVEVLDATNETTRRWANPDGTFTDEVYIAPVRAHRNGAWVPIDTALSARDGALRPGATMGDVAFSAGGDTELASVSHGDHAVSLAWPKKLPVPTVSGNTARYADVLPGIDLEVKAEAAGFEQSFILKSRAAASAPQLQLPLALKGLTPVSNGGALAFRDAGGTERAWVGSARMWDAKGRTAPVGVAVKGAANARGLAMTPDAAFLADPSITFPVTVDPQVTVFRYRDAYIDSTNTTTNYGSNAYLKIGKRSTTTYISYLEFPMGNYAGKKIVDAYTYLGVTDAVTCSARDTKIYEVTTAWAQSTVTWASHPTTDLTTALDTATTSGGGPSGSSCVANDWMSFHSSALNAKFQEWADDGTTNHGLSIRTDNNDTSAAKDFASGENTSWTPRVILTWDTYPASVTGRYHSPVVSYTPTGGTTVRYAKSRTPKLGGIATDADGGTTRIDFEIWNSTATTRVAYGSSPYVTQGTTGYWTTPTQLTDGTFYQWRAKGYDGYAQSKTWSGWLNFTVDVTAPPTTTVSSTAYPANTWSGSHNQAGSFTVAPNGATDLAGYTYRLDTGADTYVAATGSTSVSITPSEGPHVLYVQSVDRAGNRSAFAQHPFSVGQMSITSPTAGQRVGESVTLDAGVRPAQWTSLQWQWRRSVNDSWATVTTTTRSDTSQPFGPYTWAAGTTVGADGPFEIRGVLSDGTTTSTSLSRSLVLTRGDFGTISAMSDIGPASVNLQSGNVQVTATDVSFDGGTGNALSVGRTFNSRDAGASPKGPFGPGWITALPITESVYSGLAATSGLVTVTKSNGDTVGFSAAATAGTFDPEPGAEDMTLVHVTAGGADTYELTEINGDVTTFTKPTNSVDYAPTSVLANNDSSATVIQYAVVSVGGTYVTRPTGLMAPAPAGVTGCSLSSPTAVVGCRSLKLTYAPSNTAPPSSGQTGAYADRLVTVEAIAYDPDATPAAMSTVAVRSFSYDSNGRLAASWDPRLSTLKTQYTYNSAGQIAMLTPPSEEPWTFTYGDRGLESNAGRLRSVSRPTLLVSPTTATTTVVYGVPVSGTGAPWNLSSAELDRTGQMDRPTMATAIFPATTTATLGTDPNSPPTGTAPYDRATVVYMNADGREVNRVDANGGISTTEHDAYGNVVRTLSAANRADALDRGTTTAEEAEIAQSLSNVSVFGVDGLELLELYGPEHDVVLSDDSHVRARSHVTHTYDENPPTGSTEPYHLITTTTSSAQVAGETTDRASETRTTKNDYGTTTTSWGLGLPVATTADAGTGKLNITSRKTYTTDGRVATQTLPAGGTTTNTAATRVNAFYSAGTHSTDAACGNKPQWADQLCALAPGGQPATGATLPTTYMTYDMWNHPRVVTEKAGGTTLRTITNTYDSAGRAWRSTVTASTGTALPTTENYYDTSGRLTETRSLDSLGAVTSYVGRTYNSLNQLTSYRDATGSVTTTSFDVLGRPLVVNDSKGTQTLTYDGGTERRGLPTTMVDSHAGTFTATYDVAITPVVTMPNGLMQVPTVDEVGETTGLDYTLASCSTDCSQVAFGNTLSVHGQIREQASTLSDQTFTYDGAGRLTEVKDVVGGVCTTRQYAFDSGGNGNRTQLATFAANTADGTSCQTSTAASTVTSTHDAADRIATTGTVYDALGRTTTVPDADALDSGALTVGYHVNDVVRSISRAGGSTLTYTLDVNRQRVLSWTDGSVTKTHHYSLDSDNPTWTQETSTAWTRNIRGLTGALDATYDSATATVGYLLHNLHGDVVATTSGSSPTITATFGSTEYGAPRGATGARYGWIGAQQRASDTPGGLTLMGMRLYNPQTGRFLQVDPVYGGSANAYDYVNNDPVNVFDIAGTCPCLVTGYYWRVLAYGSAFTWSRYLCFGSAAACTHPSDFMGQSPAKIEFYSLCGWGCITDLWGQVGRESKMMSVGLTRLGGTLYFWNNSANLVQRAQVWSWAAPWLQSRGIYRTLFWFRISARVSYRYWA